MDKKKLQIIGLAGTNGSGKDTIGHLLSEYHNYLFVSVTDLLRTELKARDLPITRKNMRMVGGEWRREQGLGALIDVALKSYEAVKEHYTGVVIASLRNPGEADRVHERGGLVVWIDANPQIRYQRVRANAAIRGRAGEDNKTYEQFLTEEETEMNPLSGSDDAALNMLAVKELSDTHIDNSESDVVNLRNSVEKTLGL